MRERMIQRVLMCEPGALPAAVPDPINPWMEKGTRIDRRTAYRQWENLVSTYEGLKIKVDTLPQQPGLADMVFAADNGLVEGKSVLLSRFKYASRQPESEHYGNWFAEHGYTVDRVPADRQLEGNGEVSFWDNKVVVGIGFRSDENTVGVLRDRYPDREVVDLKLEDPRFYHLDLGFLPAGETIFYLPKAFSNESQQKIKSTFADKANLEVVTEEEAELFGLNSFFTGNHLVFQAGNPKFEDRLRRLDIPHTGVDLSGFKPLGGGTDCLTMPLAATIVNKP